MAATLLFNKPFNVLSQFTDSEGRQTLADFISQKDFYPAGRLDYDSEGLMILVSDGQLQARISDPKHKLPKTYWVQVEGDIDAKALNALQKGVELKDGPTKPAKARRIDTPDIWDRNPPVRKRKTVPTSWLELTITEGRNRQVRRMTATVGFPTLRLIRVAIGPWKLDGLSQGESRLQTIHLPSNTASPTKRQQPRRDTSGRNKANRAAFGRPQTGKRGNRIK
ncbi:pseudouridine synthase [Oleiphilus sp. HI0079]|uniref:pseudouridine synthase n=1 Tax=Oleiphilus sp. HI0079 TaxID=1822254 RepID=UPI0007C27FAC|nr:pseudouridine synthase [Oleiphilus sp. HI0079]KZZ13143.1 pseudouridine synthase [Oleiphilus sp. HI0079]